MPKSTLFLPSVVVLLLSHFTTSSSAYKCFTSNTELLAAVRVHFTLINGDQFDQVAFDQMEQDYGTIDVWCTTGLTDFSSAFSVQAHPDLTEEIRGFNKDLSLWDTASATDMSYMFFGAEAFNSDNLANWEVGSVQNFESMFDQAKAFNQPIGTWDMLSATNLKGMFLGAETFNQNLNGWNTPNVEELAGMFMDAKAFNGDLSSWDVSKVKDFSTLFQGATKFNSNIGNWQMGNALNFARMFMQASSFNQNIGNWQTSQVTDFLHLFDSASAFNQDIGNWDTGKVTNMANAFRSASSFNQDLSGWDMSNVSKHDKMFMGASSFNQDLCAWREVFEYSEVGNLFTETACVFDEDPDPALKAPFCKEFCGTMVTGPPGQGTAAPGNSGGTPPGEVPVPGAPTSVPPGDGTPPGEVPVPVPGAPTPVPVDGTPPGEVPVPGAPTFFPAPPPTIAAPSAISPSGPSRLPTAYPASPNSSPSDTNNNYSQIVKRKPMDDQTKALIFGIGGAVILAIVALCTACCGEPAGSKQYEMEMGDMMAPSIDPNALPSSVDDDPNYYNEGDDYSGGDPYDDDDDNDYESDTSPELV